jgi:multiple sugar transport system substrate-binding protein
MPREVQTVRSGWRRRAAAIAAGVLAAGLALLLAAVCAAPGPRRRAHPDRIPVHFWHMWTADWKAVVERIVAEFNASQTRYEVIPLSVPSASADSKFLLAVAGGEPPDLMAQWNQVIPAWADSGLLMELDQFMTPEEWTRFQTEVYPVALKIGRYKGHLYGLCTAVNIWACYYRPDHFREAGLDPDAFPETLEGLWAIGRTLERRAEDGRLVRMGFLPQWLNMYAPIFGGGFWDEAASRAVVDTPANLRALTFLAECRKALGFDEVVRFESSLNQGQGGNVDWPFISGRYSIVVDGQWRVEQLVRNAPDLEYRAAPIPPPTGGKRHAGWSNGNFMIIPKGAAHPEGAWEFAKFWAGWGDPARAAEFCTWGGWLPLWPPVAEAPAYRAFLAKHPAFGTFLDVLPSENIVPSPPVPYQVFLNDQIGRVDDYAMRGTKTPEAALRGGQAELNAELARRRRFGL